MPEQTYEKVSAADLETYSDSSGSEIVAPRDSTSSARHRGRSSADRRRHDRETLNAEEEAERLLSQDNEDGAGLGAIFRGTTSKKNRKGLSSLSKEKDGPRGDTDEEEVRSMEHGGDDSSNSSEVDLQRLVQLQHGRQKSRWLRWTRSLCIYLTIAITFVLLLFGAYQATRRQARTAPSLAQMLSNGTHMFAPTTIVISLDGFRADFLNRNLTPTLNAFIRDGVSPRYMLPSFPSLTFPNHFTLATGHYPESHGIVGNTFWDPVVQKEFYYTDPERSMQPEWWNAEPFWVTSEMQGVRTAIHMWPGSEAHLGAIEPAFVDEYNGDELLDRKVQRILGWLDLPGPDDDDYNVNEPRPQLIAAYVPDVDADGHNYGPNSTEIRTTITHADNMLADIFRGVDERNLTKIVNIIVVSDHGMATTDVTRLIQLEDLMDIALLEHVDGWPLYGLRPFDQSQEMLQRIYDQLLAKSQEEQYQHAFDVYLRDVNMPERYHFSNNPRIAPLWIVPKAGWAVVPLSEFNVAEGLKNNDVYHPRGLHGYDFEHPLMRAIFVARGPAFPHPKGSAIEPFQNLAVYNIICDSLGIEPLPNNGTIRLPLKTSGKHEDMMQLDTPEDPPASAVFPAIAPVPIPTEMPPLEDQEDTPSLTFEASTIWTTDTHGSLVTVLAGPDGVLPEHRPWTPNGDEGAEYEENENINAHQSWYDWFEDQFDDFKDWTSGIFHPGGDDDLEDDAWETIYSNDTTK